MKRPTVSVIMPVYNGAKYIKYSIESILNQTYKDFEFIIVNDGSTDKTEEIILSYLKDPRIIYVKTKKNNKIAKALNLGLQISRGLYIARMDSDDISNPKRLELQLNFMERRRDVGICGSWIQCFGERTDIIKYPTEHEQIMFSMLFYCPIAHPTVFFRRSIVTNNIYYYDSKYNEAEDYELWTRIVFHTRFTNIPLILLKCRIYDSERTEYKERQLILGNRIKQKYEKIFFKEIYKNRKHIKKDFYLFFRDDSFIIFGAGSFGKIVKDMLINNNKKVAYFVDNDIQKQGKMIDNIEIKHPSEIKQFEHKIIIASMWRDEISEQLKREYGLTYLKDYL